MYVTINIVSRKTREGEEYSRLEVRIPGSSAVVKCSSEANYDVLKAMAEGDNVKRLAQAFKAFKADHLPDRDPNVKVTGKASQF